jgi:hypothetical protein
VNRIGSHIGTAFIDGGVHPKFGTRNFTAPLLNGQYIEVVCPMDHPATDSTPFGRSVKKKVSEGGGWLSWVISSLNIEDIEKELGRKAVDGKRKKPDGTELSWKQLGVLSTLEDASHPFYVEWESPNHPSLDGQPSAKISCINFALVNKNFLNAPGVAELIANQEIELKWVDTDWQEGISHIDFVIKNKIVSIK